MLLVLVLFLLYTLLFSAKHAETDIYMRAGGELVIQWNLG